MTTRSAAYDLYKDDYQFVDGIETVTVTDGTSTTTTAKAKRSHLTKREVSAGEALGVSAHDIAWTIWDTTLGSVVLGPECILTDSASVAYTILSATKQEWDTQWRCLTSKRK